MQAQSTPRGARTKENMFGLMATHDRATTTVKDFCQQHGLAQGTFYYWQKKYHLENGAPESQNGFVQLQTEDPQHVGAHQGLFAEVRGIKLYQAVPAAYLNELLNGVVC